MCTCQAKRNALPVAQRSSVPVDGVHCTLNQSPSFVETLIIKPVAVLQDYHEILVQSQRLHAQKPDALQVRYRTIVPNASLHALRNLLNRMHIDWSIG